MQEGNRREATSRMRRSSLGTRLLGFVAHLSVTASPSAEGQSSLSSHHVIAGEAKQSLTVEDRQWDCFVTPILSGFIAMNTDWKLPPGG